MGDLREQLSVEWLLELAGDAAFKRGQKYFDDGQVATISDVSGGFGALVLGNEPYNVQVSLRGSTIKYECSCPVGQALECCKHVVAASLAWLDQGPGKPRRESQYETVREWLKSQDAGFLAGVVFDQALRDQGLFRQLSRKATRGSAQSAAGLRKFFDQATRTRKFVPYDETHAFAEGIFEVLDEFEQAIVKSAADVIELCEHAIQRVKQAFENVDDSEGELMGIIERAQEIHLKACKAAKPDQELLAQRLFKFELGSEYGEFANALESYEKVLGKPGVAEFTRLAREAWDKLPVLQPPQSRSREVAARVHLDPRQRAEPTAIEHEVHRPQLKRIMLGLAQRQQSFEAQAEVLCKDLSDAHTFIELSKLCREHKHFEQALEWARKGVEAFKHEHFVGLEMLLAKEYREAGRHDAAIEVVWRQFTDRPYIDTFARVLEYAKPDDRERWRDKAVGHLRQTPTKLTDWGAMDSRTLLVEIFLREKNLEMALAEADAGNCRWETLTQLAQVCSNEHPQEAIKLYQRLVPAILDNKTNLVYTPDISYSKAAEMMLTAAKLYGRLNQKPEFNSWLTSIREKYKAKRNFIKLLGSTSWP